MRTHLTKRNLLFFYLFFQVLSLGCLYVYCMYFFTSQHFLAPSALYLDSSLFANSLAYPILSDRFSADIAIFLLLSFIVSELFFMWVSFGVVQMQKVYKIGLFILFQSLILVPLLIVLLSTELAGGTAYFLKDSTPETLISFLTENQGNSGLQKASLGFTRLKEAHQVPIILPTGNLLSEDLKQIVYANYKQLSIAQAFAIAKLYKNDKSLPDKIPDVLFLPDDVMLIKKITQTNLFYISDTAETLVRNSPVNKYNSSVPNYLFLPPDQFNEKFKEVLQTRLDYLGSSNSTGSTDPSLAQQELEATKNVYSWGTAGGFYPKNGNDIYIKIDPNEKFMDAFSYMDIIIHESLHYYAGSNLNWSFDESVTSYMTHDILSSYLERFLKQSHMEVDIPYDYAQESSIIAELFSSMGKSVLLDYYFGGEYSSSKDTFVTSFENTYALKYVVFEHGLAELWALEGRDAKDKKAQEILTLLHKSKK